MRVYLIGFMAAGKSSIGRLLAERLGCPFLDLDQMVEAAAAMRVSAIFKRYGEARFRDLEHRHLGETETSDPVVVATGGGVMTFARNRELIHRLGVSIWLDSNFDLMLARLRRSAAKRPLFQGKEQTRALYRSRLEAYRQADLRVEIAAGETASEVVARIADLLGERPPREPFCAT